MKENKILNLTIFLLGLSTLVCFSQDETNLEKKVKIGTYNGIEKYYVAERDSTEPVLTNYTFTSELVPQISNDTIMLSELVINGFFENKARTGNWTYKYGNYKLGELDIFKSIEIIPVKKGEISTTSVGVSLQHSIFGSEDEFNLSYSNGYLNGRATYKRTEILAGCFENDAEVIEINYSNDTIKGNFSVALDGISIVGCTNEKGYLEGVLELEYVLGGKKILEDREYKNGFLLQIRKRDIATNEELENIVFDDVVSMLDKLEKQESNLSYKVANRYFGLNFNIGYRQNDPKITQQEHGNFLIGKCLHLFDLIINNNSEIERKESILNFTNGFNYLYGSKEDSILNNIVTKHSTASKLITEYLEKPNIVLRKNNSDTLYKQYEILKFIKSKTDTIDNVLTKLNSGYFNYRSRDEYYAKGIPGLNTVDTIRYAFNGDSISIPFQFEHQITSSDTLIQQLKNYLHELTLKANKRIEKLSESLTIYQNQEKIDSLDQVISTLETSLSEKYTDIGNFESNELQKAPFSYKLMLSLNERLLDQLKSKYLNNSLPQQDMIFLGSNIICYYSILDANKTFYDNVGELQKFWNDSLFTVYKDNPFYFRKLETKILEGVQNASNILLKHYANQLLNAKNCEQIEIETEKIKRLTKRVEFLVKNQEPDNVQRLNRALRREIVPSRIERLLEL